MCKQFETLLSVKQYLENLINGIGKTVAYFQAGEDKKGCELIPLIADGLQWATEALVVTKDTHKLDINLDLMNDKLNEIVEALENQDFILIGDLFQYEVIPVIDDIREKLENCVANQ